MKGATRKKFILHYLNQHVASEENGHMEAEVNILAITYVLRIT